MSLSEAAKKAIINSERINNEEQRRRAQQQAEFERQEKEYNDLLAKQAQYEKDLAAAQQQQLTEIERLEKERKEKIAELEAARGEALRNVSREQTIVRKGADIVRPASRKQIQVYTMNINKEFQRQIDRIDRDYLHQIQQLQFKEKYPNAQLGRTALNQVKAGSSYIDAYERQQTNFEAKRQQQLQTDIARAKTYAATERAKFENIAQEFSQKRSQNDLTQTQAIAASFTSTPTKAGDLIEKPQPPKRELTQPAQDSIEPNIKAIESYNKTQQAKKEALEKITNQRPPPEEKILSKGLLKTSTAFLTKTPKTPNDIIGKTSEKSKQAIFTFEETQRQQKELSQKLSKAQSAEEAIKIKEEFQKINPYVGTPQTANTKLGKAEQGVLIEKKLESTRQELNDYFSNTSITIPGIENTISTETTTTRTYWTIPDPTNPEQTLKNKKGKELRFKTEESASRYIQKTGIGKITTTTKQTEIQAPITYEFIDKQGKTIPPTIEMLWDKMKENMTEAPTPTKADTEFNQSIREYMKANPNQELIIYKDTPGLKTPFENLPFEQAFIDHATEINYSIQNLFRSKEDQIKYEPTLEGALYYDLDTSAGNLLLNEKNPPSNYAQKYFDENIKTLEGQQKLAGSIAGSIVVLGASFIIPPIAYTKYAAKFITPKNLKRAEKIAEELRYTQHQETNKLPTTLDDMNAILRENKKAVGVEMLNPNTALIKRGTETNPEQTAYILLRFGKDKKQAIASLYQGFQTDRPGSYREIIIYGKQGKELKYGKREGKQTVIYPSTLKNFIQAYDPQHLAGVGSKQDVLLSDLEKYPKQVIKSVETQEEVKGSVLLETQRLSNLPSEKGAAISKEAGDTFKGDLGSKEFDYYLPQKNITEIKTTKTKPYESPTDKKISDLPSSKKPDQILQSQPGKGGDLPGEKINIKIDMAKLKNFVETDVIKTSSNISDLTATGSISSSIAAIRSQTQTGFREATKTATNSKQNLESLQETKMNLDLETKPKIKYTEMEKIILDLEQIKGRRQVLDPRFSLITSTETILDETQKEGTVTKEIYQLKERLDQTFPRPTPTEEKTTFKTPPNLPGFTLNLEEKKELGIKQPKQRKGILFFRWNVNTEEVGQYLPTRDLSTGKTSKTIKKIDQLEKKVNKKGYWEKKQQQIDNYYSLDIKENKGGALVRKSNIINISEPKGKEARKFLKKFKVNLGF